VIVAYWNVDGQDRLADKPMLAHLEEIAEGELRLAASREDAEVEGPARKTEIRLYWYETGDPEMPRRLEPANMLRVAGQPIPDTPAATMVRWEQDARRRAWPATRRRPA
jgi:hypothetical protein